MKRILAALLCLALCACGSTAPKKKYPLSPIPDAVLEVELSGADLEKLKGNQSDGKK